MNPHQAQQRKNSPMAKNQSHYAAKQCLALFADIHGAQSSPADAAQALITAIGHHCNGQRIDFLATLRRAVSMWCHDTSHPAASAPLPKVTILIQ